jgi:hypothetical protein
MMSGGVTLGESSASTSRRHDHALYFVRREVLTAVAGVIALASKRLILALCRKWSDRVKTPKILIFVHNIEKHVVI